MAPLLYTEPTCIEVQFSSTLTTFHISSSCIQEPSLFCMWDYIHNQSLPTEPYHHTRLSGEWKYPCNFTWPLLELIARYWFTLRTSKGFPSVARDKVVLSAPCHAPCSMLDAPYSKARNATSTSEAIPAPHLLINWWPWLDHRCLSSWSNPSVNK